MISKMWKTAGIVIKKESVEKLAISRNLANFGLIQYIKSRAVQLIKLRNGLVSFFYFYHKNGFKYLSKSLNGNVPHV